MKNFKFHLKKFANYMKLPKKRNVGVTNTKFAKTGNCKHEKTQFFGMENFKY